MAHSDGLITKPVNTTDVCSTIGEDKHRIGYLCVSENVNPQSKHKPMRHSTLAELTNEQKISKNWGYHIPDTLRLANIVSLIQAEDKGQTITESSWIPTTSDEPYVYLHYGWWYEKPQGGATSPYRLGDFNGYKHDTPFFIGVEYNLNSNEIQHGFYASLNGEINVDDPNDVQTSDFSRLSNKVLMVGALPSNSSDYTAMKFKTGPAVMPDGTTTYRTVVLSDEDVLKMFGASSGNFNLYFFLVERPSDQSIIRNGYYLPMSNLYMVSAADNYGRSYYSINEYVDNVGTIAELGTKSQAMTLPIPSAAVHYTYIPVRPTDPYSGYRLTATGSITIASNGRVTVVGAITITNNTGASVTINKATILSNLYIQVSAYGASTGNLYTSEIYQITATTTGTLTLANGVSGSLISSTTLVQFTESQFMPSPNGDSSFINPSAGIFTRNRINAGDEWTYFNKCVITNS